MVWVYKTTNIKVLENENRIMFIIIHKNNQVICEMRENKTETDKFVADSCKSICNQIKNIEDEIAFI